MCVINLYTTTRKSFVEISILSDKEHARLWDEVDSEFAYSWFASLASALNNEISLGVEAEKYKELFNFFSVQYEAGSNDVKNCIDASFIENLFWHVLPRRNIKPYWTLLPKNLKELYTRFHGKAPF